MAVVHRSSRNWTLSLKAVLISSAVVSTAVVLKLFVPLMLEFAVSGVPVMWSSFRSWLKPPYLYVVINGIIITIAASSRLCYKLDEDNQSRSAVLEGARSDFVYESKTAAIAPEFVYDSKTAEIVPEYRYELKVPEMISPEFTLSETETQAVVVYEQSENSVPEVKTVVENFETEDVEGDEFVISRSNWSPAMRTNSSEILLENLLPAEKPLVSARFSHRKPVKPSPEGGKALRVTKPKRQQETLESTWKAITDGRHMPLTRHLKKSDTLENHGRQENIAPLDRNVMKAETFKDRTNYNPPPSPQLPPVNSSSPGSGKLRKEPSLSQDDLNRRVEAFIKKFNEEMRLQRQESLNQYHEMINRGVYD